MRNNHSNAPRPSRPLRVVEEENGRPRRSRWRSGFLITVAVLLVLVVLLFPRVLGFFELAAREIRYLWWLVLLGAIGVWLAFFFGRKRDD